MRYTRRRKTKQKHSTIYVGHSYTQPNTNNANQTFTLLQTTGGKDEPNIVYLDIYGIINKQKNKQQLIRNKRRYLCSYSMSVCMISYFCYKLTLFLYDIPWMTSNYENLYNRRIMMDDSKRLMKNKQQPWKWTDWTTIIQDIAIRFGTSYPSRDLDSLPGFYLIIILLFIQVAFCVVCLFVVVVLCLVPNDARVYGLSILDWPFGF